MARNITLSRDEAELLTDLLDTSDHYLADRLNEEIRALFGMVSKEQEAINKAAYDAQMGE